MDLDGDGCNDILSGSYSRMSQPMAGLFQVLWGQPDGKFKAAAVLNGTDDQPLIIPADSETIVENICTRPMAVDWDGDGDLDLVVGNFAGSFYVFIGEGKGRFLPEPKQITTAGGPLKIQGVHSDPFPIDWDGDGDIDLLSGSSHGGVQWAENTAGVGKTPEFTAFRELIPPGQPANSSAPLSETDLTGPTSSTRIWVDDVNGDGKLDVLVGDRVTLVALAPGLSNEDFQKRQEQWQKEMQEVSNEYRAAASDAAKQTEAMKKLQEHYARRSEFIKEEATGFVWLYLQR